MASIEFGENPALGQELLVGISVLGADALERSGLLALADIITYSSIEFSRLHTPDEEITLFIGPDQDGNHIITLSENPRVQLTDEEIFDLGPMTSLTLEKDGGGIAPRNKPSNQDMSVALAAEYIIKRLPDFVGAAATIEVLAEEAK